MSNKQSSRAGTIREFKIFQPKDGGGFIDASAAVLPTLNIMRIYYLHLYIRTAIITETGESDKKALGNKGMLDGLPIRGGNASEIIIEDHDGHKLKFKGDKKLYVNRVRNVIAGTQKDVYALDFVQERVSCQ